MSDTEPNEHDQKPANSIFLELVIKPTIGVPNQDAVMYFRYSDIYGHGNATEADRVRYLQTEIQARYTQLNANSAEATGELRGVLREWAPNLKSPARFTVQIPGQLDLPGLTGAKQTADADLQVRLSATEHARLLAEARVRMVLRDQQRQRTEWETKQQALREQAAADEERLRHEQDTLRAELRAEHIERRDADSRLDLLKREVQRLEAMLSGAQQQGGQVASDEVEDLLGKLAEAYQTNEELEDQIKELIRRGEAGQGGPSWRNNPQPRPANAQPAQSGAAHASVYQTQPDEDEPPSRYPAVSGLEH